MYNCTSDHFCFQEEYTTRCTAQGSAPQEEIPSPLSLRDAPERGYSTIALRLWLMPAYWAEPSPRQAQVLFFFFFFNLSADHRELHMQPKMQAGRDKAV